MKKVTSTVFLLLISFAGSSIASSPASACAAGGGSAIGCGIQCMDVHPFALQALCAMMSPAPQPPLPISDLSSSSKTQAN